MDMVYILEAALVAKMSIVVDKKIDRLVRPVQ